MAISFINNCGFVPTAGGTTDWTFSSVVTGYQSPTNAGAVNGATYVVRAQSADQTQWEYAVGAYNSGTGVFARTTVLYNSSGTGTRQSGAGTKISFTLAPSLVAIVAMAEDLVRSHSVIPNGRLTLTTGTPVTTSDVTGATSVFYTPYNGNVISLFDGNIWIPIVFPETTLSLSGLTANTNYDVWGRILSGALALDTTAWTNDTTRATAIAPQDGIDIKSGDATRRLLGTIRITGTTGQTADTVAFRFVSNRYNTEPRHMKVVEATASWAYSSGTYRQANGNTANQLDFVLCSARLVSAEILLAISNTTTFGTGAGGIGVDSTTTDSSTTRGQAVNPTTGGVFNTKANYSGYVAAGRHTLVWLESSAPSAGTMTFYGAPSAALQCGITGFVVN
jgi:hypothetical protein